MTWKHSELKHTSNNNMNTPHTPRVEIEEPASFDKFAGKPEVAVIIDGSRFSMTGTVGEQMSAIAAVRRLQAYLSPSMTYVVNVTAKENPPCPRTQ